MAFMELFTKFGQWYIVEVRGSSEFIPANVIGDLPLPDGYTFDKGQTVSADTLHDWFVQKGHSEVVAGLRATVVWKRVHATVRDYIGESVGPCRTADDLDSVELRECWGAHYSAPGYMDQTDWCLADTEEEAIAECKEMYGDDDEDEQETCRQCGDEFPADEAVEKDFCSEECRDQWDADHIEPEDGDWVTEDYELFRCVGSKQAVIVPDGEDWRVAMRGKMDAEQFWPNVWCISDHGNAHLLSMDDEETEDEDEYLTSETDAVIDGFRYVTWIVDVPFDAFDNDDDRLNCAIGQAREGAMDYCIPAEWTAERIDGSDNYRVTRRSNAPNNTNTEDKR